MVFLENYEFIYGFELSAFRTVLLYLIPGVEFAFLLCVINPSLLKGDGHVAEDGQVVYNETQIFSKVLREYQILRLI